ncbi:MIG17-like protein [Mya arenaria]|uniref:MIG17-like protein n=1 Tax=Mya arenaria TaxID=6604 RepID=A0ABY7E353_MYAAR|nr:MIG17-like protein [Mya arenaria]
MESSKVARVVFGFILLCGIGESFLDDSVVVVDLNYDPLMRQLGGGQLPGSLTFRLERPGQENVHLNLVENRRLNQDAPMLEVKRQQDGTDKLVQRQCRKIEDAKFYQDKTNKASLMVSCVGRGYGPCKRQLTGSIELDDVAYEIMPVPEMASHERSFAVANKSPHIMMRVKDMASGGSGEHSEEETTDNKEKIPPRPHPNGGRRGAQGFRESFDDAKVPPELERKEIDEPFDDAKIPPEEVGKGIDGHSDVRMKLLTELKEVLMRKYPQPPGRRLHSNRQKRQSRVYALEVLVGIDPSVWAWYYEQTNAADGMTKEEMTEHEIRKQFSHIINGISQRYENIEDPEMNIYVTVSGFLIYKTRDSTNPLPLSTPIQTVEDSQLVDGEVYLDSLAPWLAGLSGLPHNDHAMVFTRYDLQADGSTGVVGIAWLSNVCKFYRVSINEESSYFITTSVGAHELGHNRKDEYTMNPWKFSDCSVNAFKSYVSLLDTENNNCLLDHGDYYNEDEYKSHVSQLPGQLYTVEEQCKRTRGDNSTQSCGQTSTDPVICRALLCSGGDDFCYYQAALPGTPCDAPATNKIWRVCRENNRNNKYDNESHHEHHNQHYPNNNNNNKITYHYNKHYPNNNNNINNKITYHYNKHYPNNNEITYNYNQHYPNSNSKITYHYIQNNDSFYSRFALV